MATLTFEDVYLDLLRQRTWDGATEQLRASGRRLTPETTTPTALQPLIQQTAQRYDVDPALVTAVMQIESQFNPRARSPKGALGLMQLMPGTAAQMGVRDPFDSEENLEGGVKYLALLQKHYPGRPDLVLAAYNAGPGAVQKHGGIPPYPETQQYVQKVLALTQGQSLSVPQGMESRTPGGAMPPGQSQTPLRLAERAQPLAQQPTTPGFQPRIQRLTPGQIQASQQVLHSPMPTDIRVDEPLTPEEATAIVDALQRATPKSSQAPEVSFERSGSAILQGAASAAGGTLRSPLALGLIAEDSPAGAGLRKLAQPLEAVEQAMSRKDPTLIDQLFTGLGSQLSFLIPSLGVAKALQVGAGLTKLTGLTMSAVNAVMESATEASESYETLRGLVGDQEAQTRAQSVFWKNVGLIAATDATGQFNTALKPILRGLLGAGMEGLQERIQYNIQNKEMWLPADHPAAARLEAMGWKREEDRLVLPWSNVDANTAQVIGTVLGGVTGGALGVAEGGGMSLEQIGEATRPAIEQAQQALSGERGSIDLFGQDVPDDTPAGTPGTPEPPPERGQPSPEQLGLPGVPQQTIFTLPPNLAGAQLSMGQVPLQFTSDLDKAFYIIGNPKTQSTQHRAYLQEVMDFLRVPEAEALRTAEFRRDEIMAYGRQFGFAGVTLTIPPGTRGTEPPQTAQSPGAASPVSAAAPGTTPLAPSGPLLGTAHQDMQGLPLVNAETMSGLRDFLRMMETERVQSLEIDGKPLEINYAHIETDEGVKQVLAAMSDLYAEQIATIRTPRSEEATRVAASSMGLTVEQFLNLDREVLVSRKKALIGREMAVASARQLKVAAAMFRSQTMAGRDLLRTFAVHAAIQMQFARLANEAGGALQAFATPVAGDLTSLKGFEKIMEYLGSQRISDDKLAALLDNTPTPEQLQLIMEQAPTTMAKDVFLNLWYGAWLLSNPLTLMVNTISTGLMIPKAILERGIAGHLPGKRMPLETAMRQTLVAADTTLTEAQKLALRANPTALYERDVEAGEATAMLLNFWQTMARAWVLAKTAFQTGESALSPERQAEGFEDSTVRGEYHRVSADVRGIKYVGGVPVGPLTQAATFGPLAWAWDALGAIAQTTSNTMMMTDEFFKAIHFQMNLQSMAYRVAVQQGLAEGKTVRQALDAMQEFMRRPPPGALDVIKDEMRTQTFTRPLNDFEGGALAGLGAGVQAAANQAPILKAFVPFVRTGVNITYTNMEALPGINLLVRESRRDILYRQGSQRDLAVARMMLGGTTALAIAILGPLGLQVLRGFGPDEPHERRAEEEVLGRQRYSLRIPWGDTTLAIGFYRMDPFSQMVGFLTDWGSKYQEISASDMVQEWLEVGAAGLWAMTKNISNRNYQQSLQEFFELVQDDESRDPEVTIGKWERWINKQAARLVPAGVGATESAFDPTLSEVESWWDAIKSRLPGTDKVPHLDFWAEEVKRPSITPLLDLVNPFPVQLEKRDATMEELLHQGATVSPPSRFLLLPRRPQQGAEDEAVKLSPTEWNRLKTLFAKEGKDADGRDLRQALEATIKSDDYQALQGGPHSTKTKALNQVIAAYKEMAKAQFMAEGLQPGSPLARVVQKQQIAAGVRQSRQGTPQQGQDTIQDLLQQLTGGSRP